MKINTLFFLLFVPVWLSSAGLTQEKIESLKTFENSELKNININFTVKQSIEDRFWADMTLTNHSSLILRDWQLGFTFQKIITAMKGARIAEQVGDYYLIGSDEKKTILPGESYTFSIEGDYTIRNYQDAPSSYFLLIQNEDGVKTSPLPISGAVFLLPYRPAARTPGINDYDLNIKHLESSIEGNAVETTLTPENSLIVPLPTELTLTTGIFTIRPSTDIYVETDDERVLKSVKMFAGDILASTGYHLKVKKLDGEGLPPNSIIFSKRDSYQEIGREGYTLDIDSERVRITAASDAGIFYAVQSLKQLFPPQIWKRELLSNIVWGVPCLRIKDAPRFPYRGLLLDSARHFFSIDAIKRLLDLMAMHKLNFFHWHLTDDEGWRLQINRYPKLTEIGAWRGFGLPLPLSLGDSPIERYRGFYSQKEIAEIIKYAQERYITVIPEIDIPAHSRALIKSLPQLLQDSNDATQYSSVRGFHDNVLSPCMDTTYDVLNDIFEEVAALFPGSYIHIGVDERPKEAWSNSPGCLELMKRENLNDGDELQHYFVSKVQKILAAKKRSTALWEEGMKGGQLSLEPRPLIYAWKSSELGIEAAKQGYDVVLAPFQFLYLELAYSADPREPGDYWGGYIDTFRVYHFTPIPKNTPQEIVDRIKGIEGALWSEFIPSEELLDYFAFPKLCALAEVAWTAPSRRNWRNFSSRMGTLHLSRLDHYGVNYRISPPGLQIGDYAFMANDEFIGLKMRYTLDGSTPTNESTLYEGAVKITDEFVKIRSFNTMGRGSGVTGGSKKLFGRDMGEDEG